MTVSAGSGKRGRGGFRQAGSLVSKQIRAAGETRGFSIARVLTHWAEIAGADLARHTRPVDISHSRHGFGATLTILTTGAVAPQVGMQTEFLRSRVNAVYGYSAIARIRVTQTSAEGIGTEHPASGETSTSASQNSHPEHVREAREMAAGIADGELRVALADLAANILTRSENPKGSS